jgi:hypothetical protein
MDSEGEMTKKGCHAEAQACPESIEGKPCAWGIANYALAVMHGVKAFALTLRVPQVDSPHFPECKYVIASKAWQSPRRA